RRVWIRNQTQNNAWDILPQRAILRCLLSESTQVRKIIANVFASAFESVDVMFMPTTPTGAFEIGSHGDDPVNMYLEDIFTVPINLAGLPAISIPVTQDIRGCHWDFKSSVRGSAMKPSLERGFH